MSRSSLVYCDGHSCLAHNMMMVVRSLERSEGRTSEGITPDRFLTYRG